MPVALDRPEGSRARAGPMEAVAATQGPGLPSALMAGLKAAQGLAFSLRRPFFGIHHHEAHLYSPWIQGQPSAGGFLPISAQRFAHRKWRAHAASARRGGVAAWFAWLNHG